MTTVLHDGVLLVLGDAVWDISLLASSKNPVASRGWPSRRELAIARSNGIIDKLSASSCFHLMIEEADLGGKTLFLIRSSRQPDRGLRGFEKVPIGDA